MEVKDYYLMGFKKLKDDLAFKMCQAYVDEIRAGQEITELNKQGNSKKKKNLWKEKMEQFETMQTNGKTMQEYWQEVIKIIEEKENELLGE